jgi:hypothetical protein
MFNRKITYHEFAKCNVLMIGIEIRGWSAIRQLNNWLSRVSNPLDFIRSPPQPHPIAISNPHNPRSQHLHQRRRLMMPNLRLRVRIINPTRIGLILEFNFTMAEREGFTIEPHQPHQIRKCISRLQQHKFHRCNIHIQRAGIAVAQVKPQSFEVRHLQRDRPFWIRANPEATR